MATAHAPVDLRSQKKKRGPKAPSWLKDALGERVFSSSGVTVLVLMDEPDVGAARVTTLKQNHLLGLRHQTLYRTLEA